MSPVVLSSAESVERFHKFIFADRTARAPYLYGLELCVKYGSDIPTEGSISQKRLIAILEAATRLERLEFPTTLGYSVCSAVAKMATLRELTVLSEYASYDPHNPEPLTRLLTGLRSPLRYLWIVDFEQEHIPISLSFLHSHLSHFAPTLESLTLRAFSWTIDALSVTTPFAAVRSLHIYSAHQYEFSPLDVLLNLFPNLDGTLFLECVTLPHNVDECLALRRQNQDAQREHTWPGLSRVTYSPATAFIMALRCPIRCMSIQGPVKRDGNRYLTEALRDNCPQRLVLPIMLFGHDDLQILDGLFPPEAGHRLTHLVLFLDTELNSHYANISWDEFMDALVRSTAHLRSLTHLRIVLHFFVRPPADYKPYTLSPEPDGSEYDEAVAQYIAQDADLGPAATRLLDTLPSLEYVLLTTCGVRPFFQPWKHWHTSRAWRATPVTSSAVAVDDLGLGSGEPEPEEPHRHGRGGPPLGTSFAIDTQDRSRGGRSCVEISCEAAEAVVNKEELWLDMDEEDAS
uniref:Autophagy-related protein 2 n=1 Tax=Ganoderma boninense TaxID=34458 RepID=A0A5K1K6S3_9APHY|nr:Autophagy-related protein 2 [Ganoderma boninense]